MAKLSFNTPRQIALFTSGSVSVILIGLLLLLQLIEKDLDVRVLIVAPIVGFGVCYLVLRYTLERFIYDRIKVIYNNILQNRKSASLSKLDFTQDVFKEVDREVSEYTRSNQERLAEYQVQEDYRREFVGNVAHELKTPIFNIQGYVHTLLDGGLEDEEVNRKFLMRADKSVDRMIGIVQDLEVITRLESDNLPLELEKINIVDLASEVMDSLENKAQKRNIELRFNQSYEKPISVEADSLRIKQVYTNLIHNAIKYGRMDGKVTLSFFDMDSAILCEVADDGPGIPSVHLPRLFERFYRVDKGRASRDGGSGLGLAIVKHLLEAHDQTIHVRSETEGKTGTTFSFTLKKA